MSQDNLSGFPISIGALSSATSCSRETIRYYEKQGLLPEAGRSFGGHRQYDKQHLRLLQFILRAKQLGFGQDDVRKLLQMASPGNTDCERVHELASHQLTDVQERLRDLRQLEKTLRELVNSCEAEGQAAHCPVIDSLLRS